MPRSLARLSASASSHRDLSSAVFITNIAESDFRYTQPHESPLIGVPSGPRYGAASRVVEDVMRLELHYRSDIDLSQPAMHVELRSHILRCLRDFSHGGEGVITLAGVEHCFMYVVQDDVVDTVIGPPDYIEQVLNERRQSTHDAGSPLPRRSATNSH